MYDTIKNFIKNNPFLYRIVKDSLALKKRLFKKIVIGKNNRIANNAKSSKLVLDIMGNNNSIEIGSDTTIGNVLIYIRGNNHKLQIGDGCIFKEGSIWFEDEGGELTIGNKTTIESAHFAITEPGSGINVGSDCMFSYAIEFRTGDSHSIIDIRTGDRINYARNIRVEDHVWIGAKATILKGIILGAHSIVATGAIVLSDVPANSIVAGIPAKPIRDNITWHRERTYKK